MSSRGQVVDAVPGLRRVVQQVRAAQRQARTARLVRQHPSGGYLDCHGVAVHCDFHDPSYAWYDGPSANLGFDLAVLDALLPEVQGNVHFDIGAHWGFFSAAIASRARPDDRLVAVEADARNLHNLRRTIERIDRPSRVHVEHAAIAAADGTLTLFSGGDDCSHVFPLDGQAASGQVTAVRMDSLVDRLVPAGERVGFVKVDVDGAEPGFVEGARRTIEEHSPVVLMEFAPRYLAAFGVDPGQFLADVLGRFSNAYWLSYVTSEVTPVGPADARTIVDGTGGGISDLVLAPMHLPAVASIQRPQGR
jgi:FkbM family methyltransferase